MCKGRTLTANAASEIVHLEKSVNSAKQKQNRAEYSQNQLTAINRPH